MNRSNLKKSDQKVNEYKGLTTDEIYHEISEKIQNIITNQTKTEREIK